MRAPLLLVGDISLMLQQLIVMLLDRLESAPYFGILSGTIGSPITLGVAPLVQGTCEGFKTPDSSSVPSMEPSRFTTLLVSTSTTMLIAKKKRFERFVRLVVPRFNDIY